MRATSHTKSGGHAFRNGRLADAANDGPADTAPAADVAAEQSKTARYNRSEKGDHI